MRRIWFALLAVPLFIVAVIIASEVYAHMEVDDFEHYIAATTIMGYSRSILIGGIAVAAAAGAMAFVNMRRARSCLAAAALIENAVFLLLFVVTLFQAG